ncbi:hypothetical protein ACQEVF_54260 [Nonomuraea polychroma]|uniref:hypothetical protein n=1 Tax=Nonomuraea polychroma TaxID=46176 RepID=UPI003D8BD42A
MQRGIARLSPASIQGVYGTEAGFGVWEPKTGKDSGPQSKRTGGDPVFGVATDTMDGNPCAVTASADDTAQVWNLETGVLGATFRGHTGDVFTVATAVMDDAPLGISGGSDQKVRVWALLSGKPIDDPLKSPGGRVYSVVIAEDDGESWLAAGDVTGNVTGWSLGPASP